MLEVLYADESGIAGAGEECGGWEGRKQAGNALTLFAEKIPNLAKQLEHGILVIKKMYTSSLVERGGKARYPKPLQTSI